MSPPSHILTVLTPDRRGIIATITSLLDRKDIKVMELSQTVVRDYFTIILVLHCANGSVADALAQELETALSAGARVTLVEYLSGRAQVTLGERYILTANGDASRGVVHAFAEIVANRGGNFSDLSTREDGLRLTILAEIDLPSEDALEQLQIDLERAGTETGLQVRLQHHRLFVATNEVAFRRIADDS